MLKTTLYNFVIIIPKN